VLAVAGVVVGLAPTLGFTSVTADRGTSVATADAENALIALESSGATVDSQTGTTAATLRNNANETLSVSYRISLTTNAGDLTIETSDGQTTLSPDGELPIALACRPGNRQGTAQLQVTVPTAGGSTVSIGDAVLTRTVSYDCEPGRGGSGGTAFNDENGDGVLNDGEQSYSVDELRDFDNRSVNLVIRNAGTIDTKGTQMSMKAATIRVQNTTLESNKRITLDADGSVDISTARVESNKQISLNGATFSGAGATVSTQKRITVDVKGAVDLGNARLDTNKEISVTGSVISARGAVFDTNKDISLTSDTSINLEKASIATNKQASASLATTLFVDDLSVQDKDDTLTYGPSTVTVRGTASRGEVSD